jgi:uracil-DNA glycosylase
MISSFFAPKKIASSEDVSKSQKASSAASPSSSKKRSITEASAQDAESEKGDKRQKSTTTSLSSSSSLSSSAWANAFENMEPSWKEAMGPYLKKGKEARLIDFLEREQSAGKTVYPPPEDVFSFMECPLDKIRVVIVGQDPYHQPGQAHGMCFSVRKGVQVPPSLRNMLKEAKQDADLEPRVRGEAGHGYLGSWSKQGVLLLNTCLTVRKAEPLSHKGKGWEGFTDEVIRQCAKRDGLVYLCWGKEAQNKCAAVSKARNLVVQTSHPSPLGAYKTTAPFMGSQSFSKCNTYLVQRGDHPINWNL